MKKTIYMGLMLAAAVVANSASAKTMLTAGGMHTAAAANSGPIMSYNVVTPEGKDFPIEELRIYAGTSASACSDLHVVGDYRADSYESMYVENGSDTVGSEDIAELVGPKATCIKWDVIAGGKTYSSDNIKLEWSDLLNEYVKANPSSFSIDFTR